MDRSGHPFRGYPLLRQGARDTPVANRGAGNGNCAEHP